MKKNRLIILTGPSCVGKTPLIKSFQKLYPHQAKHLKKIILYNSRTPRPVEVEGIDYYFRSRHEIEEYQDKENFIVMEVRGDLQALDTEELLIKLENNDVFYEGNTYIAKILLQQPLLRNINKLSLFISPFSRKEVEKLKSDLGDEGFEKHVFETMKAKLIRRTNKFQQDINDKVLKNIDRRAADAYRELNEAYMFDYIIPNHDGEDSDNWNEPIPENSDAYLAIHEFLILLKNNEPLISEKWLK